MGAILRENEKYPNQMVHLSSKTPKNSLSKEEDFSESQNVDEEIDYDMIDGEDDQIIDQDADAANLRGNSFQ